MMSRGAARVLLALVFLLASVLVSGNAANPLQQVVTMLGGMLKDCEVNAKTEEVDMVEKEGQCKNNMEAGKKSIDVDTEEVAKQEATKAKAEADAETLAAEIAKLEARLAAKEKEKTEANTTRTKEVADYKSMMAELVASMTALGQAIEAVANVTSDGSSLLQVLSSESLSAHDKALVQSFAALGESQIELDVPKVKAYESQSGGVKVLLEKLLEKFEDQKKAAETEERNTGFAFAKLVQQFEQQASADETEKKGKETELASEKGKAAEAGGLLEKSSKSLEQGKESLEDLKVACKTELDEFKQNQKVRAEEIKAIKTAIGVLGEVGNVEPPKWNALLQTAATALVQVRRNAVESHGDVRSRVAHFLQQRADELGSRSLALVATRIPNDPLLPAKQMIKDLIIKMMTEAEVDTEEKAFCKKELELNVLARSGSQKAVEDLLAELEAAQAAVATLSTQISEKSGELTELRESLKEATELRQKTKADNAATIKDAKQSQLAVEKAIKTLKSFYAKPEESALLQTTDSDMFSEEMSDQAQGSAPYAGQDAGSKILSLLDGVLSDFSKLEADTDSEEEQAQSDYEKFEVKTEETIAVSEEEKELQVQKKESTIEKIQSLQKELKNAQDKLDAGLAYYEKLKPTCVDNADWEARILARSEEIKSLQDALNMLSAKL